MAGHVIGEVGEQCAECRATDWPAVDEQHVRPATDAAVRNFSGAYIEEPFGLLAE